MSEKEIRKVLKEFLEYYESTVDYLPCDASILIDNYIESLDN